MVTGELTTEEQQELNDALAELQQELQALHESTESGTAPVKLKDNQGRLSRMDELHNQSILVANRNVAKNRLKSVQQAKSRIEDGSYGYCLDCDEPIAIARLRAYPDAHMCIGCQSASEGTP